MTQSLDQLTQALLDAARRAGAADAEALAIRGTSLSVDVRGGTLEQAERSENTDIGLRVLLGKRQAVVSSSDLAPTTMQEMADRAVAMAREAPEDPHVGLADPDQQAKSWDIDSLELADPAEEPDPDTLSQQASEAEATALAVTGVSQVQAAAAGYGRTDVRLASTTGFAGQYARTGRSLSCVAIAGTGLEMERDYDADSRIFGSDLRSPSEIGQLAAERAVARAGARKPQTGTFPVLFDERISATLIGHLLAASNGVAVARGATWLRDAMGSAVLPDGLSLIEDPHRPRVAASRPFDGEGLPTARRAIVEDGVLQSWTLDLASARKLGLPPTANAARNISAPPGPTNWNIALTQGPHSRDALLAQMGTGLLITSLIGSTINPNTGDYSRGASGFWIEGSEIAYPVNECTIAGNLRDMLRRIVPANDARPWLSRVVPSILIEGMSVAGT